MHAIVIVCFRLPSLVAVLAGLGDLILILSSKDSNP